MTQEKSKNKSNYCHSYDFRYKKWFKKYYEELSSLVLRLSGDIEVNPGPEKTTLITQNCQGLKKETKIRQ